MKQNVIEWILKILLNKPSIVDFRQIKLRWIIIILVAKLLQNLIMLVLERSCCRLYSRRHWSGHNCWRRSCMVLLRMIHIVSISVVSLVTFHTIISIKITFISVVSVVPVISIIVASMWRWYMVLWRTLRVVNWWRSRLILMMHRIMLMWSCTCQIGPLTGIVLLPFAVTVAITVAIAIAIVMVHISSRRLILVALMIWGWTLVMIWRTLVRVLMTRGWAMLLNRWNMITRLSRSWPSRLARQPCSVLGLRLIYGRLKLKEGLLC